MKGAFNERSKPREYAFFKAEGRSLTAIEIVNTSVKQIPKLKNDVLDLFFSVGAKLAPDEVPVMYFKEGEFDAPADWMRREDMDYKDTPGVVAYSPKPASDDRALLHAIGISIVECAETSTLESVFGIKIHERVFEQGTHYSSFVLEHSLAHNDPQRKGQTIIGGDTGVGYKHISYGGYRLGNVIYSDRIRDQKYGDDWYLRVPCDEKGRPVFTPPDCTEIPYKEMLKIDIADYEKTRTLHFRNAPEVG